VKLKRPSGGKLRFVLVVTSNAPSAPVLPELNCASAVGEAIRQSPIVRIASVIGFIIRFLSALDQRGLPIWSTRKSETLCRQGC